MLLFGHEDLHAIQLPLSTGREAWAIARIVMGDRLREGEVEYMDLSNWSYLDRFFAHSALRPLRQAPSTLRVIRHHRHHSRTTASIPPIRKPTD